MPNTTIIFLLGLVAFPAVCTALGAGAVFLLRKPPCGALQRGMLGFAAGVMLAASIWSLLLPAIDYATGDAFVWLSPVGGFCLGAVCLLAIEHFGAGLLSPCQQQAGEVNAGRVIFAITLHNLPEGMIVGLAAALCLAGDTDLLAGAIALSVGMGLQNIPEGASVSLPMHQAGSGRVRSFLGGAASGLVEPLGAGIAFCVAGAITPLMPWFLAAAAGAMVCVAAEDMIPLAMAKGRVGVISVVLGFALMMALDVGLG